jgi:hypothetical protein
MKNHETRGVERHQLIDGLSVVYEGATAEIPVRTPDLSTRGMFIHTTRIFPEGSILKVGFRLHRCNIQINVRAEVRHCEPGLGVGVEFVDLSADDSKAIEMELAR